MDIMAKAALVLCHAVDIGIDVFPMACLDLSNKSLKDLVDVLLVFRVDVAGQGIDSGIPADLSVGGVGEYAQCLPAVVLEDVGAEHLFEGKTVAGGSLTGADVTAKGADTSLAVVDQQSAEMSSSLLGQGVVCC